MWYCIDNMDETQTPPEQRKNTVIDASEGNPFIGRDTAPRQTPTEQPFQPVTSRTEKDPDLAMSKGAKIATVAALSGLVVAGGAALAPEIRDGAVDMLTADKVVAEKVVSVESDITSTIDKAAHELVLDAAVDPSNVNFSAITELAQGVSNKIAAMHPESPEVIPAGTGIKVELINIGTSYVIDAEPDVQLPTTSVESHETELSQAALSAQRVSNTTS
jgi:hypothetical protein